MNIFDVAKECADAFNKASGIGCSVTDSSGNNLAEYGYGIVGCELCSALGKVLEGDKTHCSAVHAYGMSEAERFGGRYIYRCVIGLNCFVSPILGEVGSAARITAGPFLMVDKEDFIECELNDYSIAQRDVAGAILDKIPTVEPARIESLSKMLFMSAGYMYNRMSLDSINERTYSRQIQEKIGGYIHQLKGEERQSYPIEKEKALLRAVTKGDKEKAQELLNQLLGHIMFSTGHDFEQIKARSYSLMVLIARAAADAGVETDYALAVGDEGMRILQKMHSGEQLCLWLSKTANSLMDRIFKFQDLRHSFAIRKCIDYIEKHYHEHITLQSVARLVFLSESYVSRVFHSETGQSFKEYLNNVRVEHSKELLLDERIRIADIAAEVGFEDQSYFTKVFKKYVGVTPNRYREKMEG